MNLTQNQVWEVINQTNELDRQCLELPNNNYEEFKEQPSSMNEEMEVTFSVADGVATAQDALPETQHDKSGGFSQRELALLKEVDTRFGSKV